jgi:hypothetical protein
MRRSRAGRGCLIAALVAAAAVVGWIVWMLVSLFSTQKWEGEMRFTILSFDGMLARLESVPGSADGSPVTDHFAAPSDNFKLPPGARAGQVVTCHVLQQFTPNTDIAQGPSISVGNCRP